MSWNERAIHLHCARKRKKRSGPSIKPEYRLELEKVNAQAVAKVVEEEFGPKFQAAGGKIVFGDNDKKLHSDVSTFFFEKILFECVKAAWGKFGIEVWPGAGKVKDRTEIVEFTGLELEDEGGFPVNSPDCQVLDQSVKETLQVTSR